MSSDVGSVITVDGRIPPEEVGITLPHEHIFVNAVESRYEPPDSPVEQAISEEPLSLDNLWWVRQNPFTHKDNLRLDSFEDAVEEVARFHRAGGNTIVDVSPKGGSFGDPKRVRAVARETGVQVVHGTAFYTREAHPDRIDDASVDDLEAEFVSDVRDGIDDTRVRAGIIGEIGTSGEVHPQEEKVLRAGTRAARRTGASLSIHPPFERTEEYPTSRRCLDILDLVEAEGLPPDRVVFCHRDGAKWTEPDLTHQKELAARGAYVEYDLFGHESRYHPDQDDAGLSDMDRVERVMELIEAGFEARLLLSHDFFTKYYFAAYGGYGFAHLLENIVPVFRQRGVCQETIDTLLVENPTRVLTFREPDSSSGD